MGGFMDNVTEQTGCACRHMREASAAGLPMPLWLERGNLLTPVVATWSAMHAVLCGGVLMPSVDEQAGGAAQVFVDIRV